MIRALALFVPLALAGCGLTPLYEGGKTGKAASLFGSVDVAPIPGKAGWLVRDALYARLGETRPGTVRYRLAVELDDRITGFGVRRDDAVTRERRTLRARYSLTDTASGKVMIDATAGSDAGIDVVSSEYATVAAENNALERLSETIADQIVTKIAMTSRAEPQ